MNLLYISISGNTKSFAQRMKELSIKKHNEAIDNPIIQIKEITDNSVLRQESEPFVVCVPTYLEGGNGIDNGDQEILTEAMRDYIAYKDNATLCLGIIGSGNKNFNLQYCLTAKQYAEQFSVPFLADFELRGLPNEIEQIYSILSSLSSN
ncbi:class Ib ribonucleoside-diphosphate reductase assembly flavoprotein NrdI [Enterococcus italicus]|uniref:Putative nrdI protein n=1 Tax=Enterococcus italicus (strain DSM 15952 / CCUG 50447 / LMG 22039 / TP 1.5) TaxID=888064 RepID=E6LHA4_ENTI1|nr:class Ib ribonucleoside-diphosphate reductase assembly flavoprotein NrdI [Enterococcus italicus]EFU73436.1 putative nrdI protein [Enterococcus italicus DSM 15952]OJG58401.1 ribonucleotide reductase [Enterococcus italicus DSM 15952]